MRIPREASALSTDYANVKDKPEWQQRLYARLRERAGDNTTKIGYRDRDNSAKNPTRADIQGWYEQIYTELIIAYTKLEAERDELKLDKEGVYRRINSMTDISHDTNLQLEQIRAERDALIDILTRAHTAEKRVEDYVRMYGQS